MRQKGFTLIELVTVMAVATILLGVGIPGFRALATTNQLTSTSNQLVSSLNLARQEAVTRGVPVSVCSSSDGASCSGGTDWTVGWMVFADNGTTPGAFDGSDTRLRIYGATEGDSTITGDSLVRYTPWGALDTAY